MQPEVALSLPAVRERAIQAVWKIQGYGLLFITFLSFFPPLFHLQEYIFFTLLAIAMLVAWAEHCPIWIKTPIDLPLFLLVAWILLTVPFATDPSYSFTEWRKLATQGLVFYWTLLVLKRNEPQLKRLWILQVVLLGTVILCVYALAEFVERGGSLKNRYIRAGAPGSDYNWLSTYLILALPILIAYGLVAIERWQRGVSMAVAAVAFLAQVLAYTRAGWLGLAAQALSFEWLSGRRWLARAMAAACLIALVGVVGVSVLGYQQGMYDFWSFWTVKLRLGVWRLGLLEVLKHPVFGVGYGNDTFMMIFRGHPETEYAAGLHNLFLMIAMGSGIPALLLLLWTLGSALRVMIRSATQAMKKSASICLIAVAVVIVGFTVRNFFDYMFAGSLAYLFWIILAFGLGLEGKPPVGRSDDLLLNRN